MTPSKGDRRMMTIRMSRELYSAVQEEARRRGMTMNDLVIERLRSTEPITLLDEPPESRQPGNPFLGR